MCMCIYTSICLCILPIICCLSIAYWLPLLDICLAIIDVDLGPRLNAQGFAGSPAPGPADPCPLGFDPGHILIMAKHIGINRNQYAISTQYKR